MTNIAVFLVSFSFIAAFGVSSGRSYPSAGTKDAADAQVPIPISLVLQPYTGSRSGSEQSTGPNIMLKEVESLLADLQAEANRVETIALTSKEEKQYGVWHRVSLANGHLGRTTASFIQAGNFVLGLLGNCNSLWGMLAGVQHSGPPSQPLKIGLIWLDAHGDFNTPETTLSGMLGGMPVAVAAGKCLFRLRLKSGLDPAVPTRHIIMMGLRDVDPLEQVLIDESHITCISTQDLIQRSRIMQAAVEELAQRVDAIYVHIDLDVLDAADIPGHSFEIPGGPTADQLGEALRIMLRQEKVRALGIASFPTGEAGRQKCLASLRSLIRGAVAGLQERIRTGS
jgi:arginase